MKAELFESWSSSLKNLLSIALVRESTRVLTWLASTTSRNFLRQRILGMTSARDTVFEENFSVKSKNGFKMVQTWMVSVLYKTRDS